jgi:hypothetical protein
MHLRIAGMTMAISSADPSVVPRVDGAAARFVVPDGGPADLDIAIERVASMPAPGGTTLFDSGAVWKLSDDDGRMRIDCHSDVFGSEPYKVAFFDRDFTTGRVLLRADLFAGPVDALEYPLDEVVIANLLARGRGIEFHGCGIIDAEGRGRLFVGQSGAGKTTTARLWLDAADVEIVSDDRVILRQIGGVWRMFGTPWHGDGALSSPASAPLEGVFLLQQAAATKLVDVAPAEAAARLFACTFPLFHDGRALAFTLDCIEKIVAAVPVRVLEFTPDRSAVEAVG